MPTTTELTEKYLSDHCSIRDSLKRGVINYSALARIIAKELGIEKRSSKEAILMASRRYREKIKSDTAEDSILELFGDSNIDIKNNIVIFTLEKGIYPEALIDVEKGIKKEGDLFFSIEGTKTITVIVQEKNKALVRQRFKSTVKKIQDGLSLITISSPGIEKTPGAVYYIVGIFFERGINIEEFMSCHDDTLAIIRSDEVAKVMEALKF